MHLNEDLTKLETNHEYYKRSNMQTERQTAHVASNLESGAQEVREDGEHLPDQTDDHAAVKRSQTQSDKSSTNEDIGNQAVKSVGSHEVAVRQQQI